MGSNTNLVSYLPFDSSPTEDWCGKTWTANGNAAISAEQYKFGSSSVHLPQSAYLQSDNTFNLDDNRWTFDTWFYIVGGSGYIPVFALGTDGDKTGISVYTSAIWFGRAANGSAWRVLENTPVPKDQWVHYAVVKDGSNYYLFENGVLVWRAEIASVVHDNKVSLGGNNYNGYNVAAYFDRTRFCQGVARWMTNFTPPTASDYL